MISRDAVMPKKENFDKSQMPLTSPKAGEYKSFPKVPVTDSKSEKK